MPVTIIDGGGVRGRNDGEYYLDLPKLASRPPWLDETDGYRDRFTESDAEVTRMFLVPWTQRRVALEYLLGYTYTLGGPVLSTSGGAGQILRRVIPMQDPERPWLFCSNAEVVRGIGAWVDAPDNVVLDSGGGVLTADPDGAVLSTDPGNGGVVLSTDPGGPVLTTAADYGLSTAPGGGGDYVLSAGPAGAIVAPAIAYVDNSEDGVAGTSVGFPDGEELLVPPTGRFRDGRALIRATFRARDYTVLSDQGLLDVGGNEMQRYVQREEDFGLEALPMNRVAAQKLKFTEGPQAGSVVPEAGVQQYPLVTLHYTWQDIPDPPREGYYACVGRVNNEPFDGFGGSPRYDTETLLCQPWKLFRRTGPTGRVMWSVRYRLMYRPQGWNRYPSSTDGQFYRAEWHDVGGVSGPSGESVYRTADFSLLFKPVTPKSYNT